MSQQSDLPSANNGHVEGRVSHLNCLVPLPLPSKDFAERQKNWRKRQETKVIEHCVRSERVTASNFKRGYARRADFDSLGFNLLSNKNSLD